MIATALLLLAVSASVPESLVVDGAPPVPTEIVRASDAYMKARSAELQTWHPTRREILITTRFGETLQIHRVRKPDGARTQITFFDDDVERGIAYEPNGASVIFTKDDNGDGNDQIYRLDLATNVITCITDGRSRNGNGVWANHGHDIVYTSTRRNGRDTDLYVNERLLAEVDGSGWSPLEWSPDDRRILVQQTISAGKSALWLADARSGAMTPVPCSGSCVLGTFTHGGKRIVTTSDAGSEFRELVSIDLQSAKTERLTNHIPWDVIELALSSNGRDAAIVTNEAGIFKLHIIDVAKGTERHLPRLPTGYVTGIHWRRNGRELGFNIDSARAPSDVYSLDIPTGTITRWTNSEHGNVDLTQFPEPRLIEWPSFDRRTITGFLYMPPPKFAGKSPVLISIHGGPEGQFTPYFLGRWNYVVNELGIAILFPNVRGSSGFGKTFQKLDDALHRENAVSDIGALLDWIAAQPSLDASRVAVTGTSYGGYLALSAAVRYDDRIRATIDIVGPTNLASFLEHTAAWRQDLRRVEYGDERDPATRAFLERIAPLRNAERITHPLLVVQGQNDPAVAVSEAEQIVRAVREHGTAVWYLLGRDEGHGFRKRRNANYQFYLTLQFLRGFLVAAATASKPAA